MMRTRLSLLAGCSLVLIAVTTSVPCLAQQKYAYSHASPPDSSKYVRDHSVDVDDAPAHKVRVVEIQRTYTKDHPVIMGVKVLETWFRGSTDYGSNGGPGHGYETWILEDGNKVFLESTFISAIETTATGSRKGVSSSTIKIVGGTGKYAALRGTLHGTAEFDTDPKNGYNRPSTRGEYWLTGE